MYHVTRDELRPSLDAHLAVYMPKAVRRTMSDGDRERLVEGLLDSIFGKSGRLIFPDKVLVPDNLSKGFTGMDLGWSDADPDPTAGVPSRDDMIGQTRAARAKRIAVAVGRRGPAQPTGDGEA